MFDFIDLLSEYFFSKIVNISAQDRPRSYIAQKTKEQHTKYVIFMNQQQFVHTTL